MIHAKNNLKYINEDTKILILGTMPSITSRDTFFYHKSTNQFWPILSKLYNCDDICHLSKTKRQCSKDEENNLIKARQNFLKKHKIGLWDIIDECYIKGSKDSSIKNPIYNDLTKLKTEAPNLEHIYFSSKKAFQYYQKYLKQKDKYKNLNNPLYRIWLENIVVKESLPSPSSANAHLKLDEKIKIWSELLDV